MYLKRLDIQGFKSFPDKITLEFNQGITSVVGPNGSGKSNIADAIRWVLGEQSVKTLRGSKMEDVIFSGTEHRKSLGFAEVSLVIDNFDGMLALEFSEVTITRRVFRSGESEYFINKSPCRLKDINELFFDTGLGKDGYSVIGQGRIEEILSTKSIDRRQIFEEASGIMKYKVRKLEAERKLESTGQNLLRIDDILNELENQLEPLSQQADTARKYLALRDNLKELEVNVYIDSISKAREKLDSFHEQYKLLKKNIDDENLKLDDSTKSHERKIELHKSLEEKLSNVRQEFYNLEGTLEKCDSEIRLNEEKINNLKTNIARIDEEIEEINKRIGKLSEEEGGKLKRIEYLNKEYNEYSSKLTEYEKKMASIMAVLSDEERSIEELKAGIMDKLDVLSDKKTQVNSVRTHIGNLSERQKNIKQEIYNLQLENDREKIKKEDLLENIRSAKEEAGKLQKEIEEAIDYKRNLETELSEQRKKQNSLKSELQFRISRYRMLNDMEKNLEGYNRSVKAILQEYGKTELHGTGIHGALAQLIKVEPRYEAAVEMALGSALQNIVTSSEEDAQKAIEFLKENKLGRATFLPVSSVRGKIAEKSILNKINDAEGFCGMASDLVIFKPEYENIIISLLGRTAVAENLDAGIKMARKTAYGLRIVTLEGDIINTSGSMSGGSLENRRTGILSRNRDILELKEVIRNLNTDEKSLEKDIESVIQKIKNLDLKLAELEAGMKEYELVIIRDESHLFQVEENIKKCLSRIEMLKEEGKQLTRQKSETETELQKYIAELKALEDEIAGTKIIIERHQEKQKEGQSVRDALHNDIMDFKISVNSILESMDGIKESIESIGSEKDRIIKSIDRRANEKLKNNEEIRKIKETNEGLSKLIKKHQEGKTGKTLEIDRITEEKKVLSEEISGIVNTINDINKNILLLNEEYGRIEVKRAKIESELQAAQNRLWDEYELTYTNALEIRKDIGSMSQAQKRINELRNMIKDLGNVNVSSIDEYVKTKERYEFMINQKDDMVKAQQKLQRIIYEMTSIMKKQFLEQFALINKNFNIVFKELFEGGRAELNLENEENVLECGIEIEAQPPGKKLQNMLLLSGGERALTAIALLFAILRLKPTPFCVLDEIEAALDDANVYRFAQYLKRYSKRTQFIMVTHRKGTMEGSDTLYGVTMQERGISKIVSLKMNERVS